MPDQGLGQLSDGLLFAAVIVYALAMLGFAGEQASRKARRVVTSVPAEGRVLLGAGGPPLAVPAETVATGAGRLIEKAPALIVAHRLDADAPCAYQSANLHFGA